MTGIDGYLAIEHNYGEVLDYCSHDVGEEGVQAEHPDETPLKRGPADAGHHHPEFLSSASRVYDPCHVRLLRRPGQGQEPLLASRCVVIWVTQHRLVRQGAEPMLRSLSYAAYAALFAFTRTRPEDMGRLEPWAAYWQHWISVRFVQSYLTTAAGASFLPPERRDLATLLEAFVLDKALYELSYELNNRLDWVRIPLQSALRLLEIHSAYV